jgi:hypothetical protein
MAGVYYHNRFSGLLVHQEETAEESSLRVSLKNKATYLRKQRA